MAHYWAISGCILHQHRRRLCLQPPQGRRRLLKLADLLEANANNPTGAKFDYNFWGYVPEGAQVAVDCGTTVCALGLAAISGQFPGLGYKVGRYDPEMKANWLEITLEGSSEEYGTNMAAEVFDITKTESGFLFVNAPISLRGAEGELALADIIRRFVAGESLADIEFEILEDNPELSPDN